MFDLSKSATNFRVSLEKKGVEKMPELEMAVIMDVSGSFDDEHRDGVTNDLLTRLIPWGMTFDPDKKVDLFTFASGQGAAHLVGSVDEKNYVGYIPKNVIGKVPGYNTGTDYAYVITRALAHFGWVPGVKKAAGLLGGLFGKKEQTQSEKRRAIVFFVTDGDNNDTAATLSVMADADRNGHEVFFVFVGVSNQSVSFSTLKQIEATCGNASFVKITDIKGFVAKSDNEVNEFFLNSKLVSWLKK